MGSELNFVYLKTHPLFSGLSDKVIAGACPIVKVKTLNRGEMLEYGQGINSKIFLLIKGKMKIVCNDELNNEMIRDILTGQDVFGDLALGGATAAEEYAQALTDNTVVCCFFSSDIRNLLQEHSGLGLRYAATVTGKLTRLSGRHADLVFHDTRSRLLRFIRYWASTDGRREGDKIILSNYLTHTDIAGVISTSRQSVNTLLNELRDAGVLRYSRTRIEINDAIGVG